MRFSRSGNSPKGEEVADVWRDAAALRWVNNRGSSSTSSSYAWKPYRPEHKTREGVRQSVSIESQKIGVGHVGDGLSEVEGAALSGKDAERSPFIVTPV
jgi:hypothetical protein